ncbi:MAG: hypothetical protein LUO89_01655 [Methanothrix sp.]|nr:hypothetical protein [Methanothrix sp.]
MPLLPLVGHRPLRDRLRDAVDRGALPASLLLHGPRGVGKQRLALWLGQLLLCTAPGDRPCGACTACRYALALAHPDLRWFFPRPRLTNADAISDDVLADYAEALAERAERGGLHAPPEGTEGLFVATVRAIVHLTAQTPALGRRKVFVVGDAERMVPQEGADQAANAFLKLLEEPPADTTLILTTSEPGALLPTIRSRVVAVRVPALPDTEVRELLAVPEFAAALDAADVPAGLEHRLAAAAGAPGRLLGTSMERDALETARTLLGSIAHDRGSQVSAIAALGSSRARGLFTGVLDALALLLRSRVEDAVRLGDRRRAVAAARGVELVEEAKLRAAGNVNPQLIGASLLRGFMELGV